MKKRLTVVLSLMLFSVLVLAACGDGDGEESGSDEKAITLRLADNHPDDYPTVIGDKKFAELVEEKTDGRYKVDVFSGGQLGEEKSVVEQLQLGSIDLTRVNSIPLTEFSDDIGVLSLPYLFEDEESKWEHLTGDLGQELLDTFEGSNLIGLAFYDSGERSIYNSKKLVKNPEDLKGLKIRVQPSDLSINIFEAFGASASPMEYGEVYSAIQTGVLDGAENNFPSYYTSNHFEIANYFTVNEYSGPPEVLLASQSLWDKLSDEDKKAFQEAALESVEYQREAWAELEAESKEAILENGNEIYEVTDFGPWRDAVEPIYEKYGSRYQEWIDKLQ